MAAESGSFDCRLVMAEERPPPHHSSSRSARDSIWVADIVVNEFACFVNQIAFFALSSSRRFMPSRVSSRGERSACWFVWRHNAVMVRAGGGQCCSAPARLPRWWPSRPLLCRLPVALTTSQALAQPVRQERWRLESRSGGRTWPPSRPRLRRQGLRLHQTTACSTFASMLQRLPATPRGGIAQAERPRNSRHAPRSCRTWRGQAPPASSRCSSPTGRRWRPIGHRWKMAPSS